MIIRILSDCMFARHAELVSASQNIDNQCIINETLKQVLDDDRFMMHNGYSN